jgi:hypothetical protein
MTLRREGFAGPGHHETGPADDREASGSGLLTSSAIVPAERSRLREVLDEARAASGRTLLMDDLTVMSDAVDPFRIDKDDNRKIGAWLAGLTQGLGDRQIHNRGLHYMILGQLKPDGTPYVSDAASWNLMERASKAARWLGYIPFDQITDERNAPPVWRPWEPVEPEPYLNVGIDIELPDADDIIPKLGVDGFVGTQPYKLVIVGEKSSLDPVLGPIAAEFGADLYLPTGDISNTHIYYIAKIGAEDGRPMRVLYFADADPSGWNMGIAIAHKLRAFKELEFHDLEFQVHRAALTPGQVQGYIDRGDPLPGSPLKPGEKRANAWTAAFGLEQTEIDALATLRPNDLRRLARQAIRPFYDSGLADRVRAAQQDWLNRSLEVINANLDRAQLTRIHDEARDKLAQMQEQIDELNSALRIDVDDFDLPEIVIPEALTQGLPPEPLADSEWDFEEHARRLIASKRYQDGGQ